MRQCGAALGRIAEFEKAANGQDVLIKENETLKAEKAQLEAERDVLHEGLKVELGCYACKNYVDDPDYDSNECMDCGKNRCNFEWRGAQKEE